jgi:hypothetical protein
VLNAVKDHSVNIDQQNIDEIKNKESRNVILDSLPTLQREELKLLNTKRKEAFEELADISNDLKHGKDTPPKRKPDGTIVNKICMNGSHITCRFCMKPAKELYQVFLEQIMPATMKQVCLQKKPDSPRTESTKPCKAAV